MHNAEKEVYIDTPDGCRIHAWWMPHATQARDLPTVIDFHGNAGNIGYRLPLLKDLYHKVGGSIGATTTAAKLATATTAATRMTHHA
jgi:hypothetical protein